MFAHHVIGIKDFEFPAFFTKFLFLLSNKLISKGGTTEIAHPEEEIQEGEII